MKFDVSGKARRARRIFKFASATAAAGVMAFALPTAQSRLQTQQNNTEWEQRAESFVELFTIDAAQARENGYRLTDNDRVEKIWRMARAHASNKPLDALARDRDVIAAYQTFAAAHFHQADRQAKERRCLADAIYYEARSESRAGQMAVAEVVLNRVRHPLYPNSICGVVYQGSYRSTGCQFTFTCDGSLAISPRGRAWTQANKLAAHAMLDMHERRTNGATHYHTTAINPYWAPSLVQTGIIGSHKFYRFPGAAGRLPDTDA